MTKSEKAQVLLALEAIHRLLHTTGDDVDALPEDALRAAISLYGGIAGDALKTMVSPVTRGEIALAMCKLDELCK